MSKSIEEKIKRRIGKLNKDKSTQKPEDSLDTDLDLDEGIGKGKALREAESKPKRLKKHKEKKMNGYINTGGGKRGK